MTSIALLRPLANRANLAPALATLAAAAAFVAVSLWSARLMNAPAAPAPARVAPPAPFDVSAGAQLFGAKPGDGAQHAIQLFGILSFDARHAAAIVSVGGDAARVVRLGGALGDAVKLAEVRARSIVVETAGLQREIALPAAQNPNAFVR
ncbi:general secretion pathway protein GspC [Burkholderia ubonensis]|uniref:General secretion pathway protein GspC n=1 Tax=Burkholderia ubonensis subsp. mesacidophila TaxID=265293 RepID=A0A2A4FGL2_9BURK|nr:general secretion pathway protein GspC [Burkholderia ubonensis]PCE32863.1 general secretion pathway protein GspC [Burkholderia ubonensis subsp. mesacidophila]